MTREELRELIQSIIREYMGTGDMASTGLTSDDGNNVVSPRPFSSAQAEINNYLNKSPYGGGDGGHYTHEPSKSGLNRTPNVKF